MDPRTDNAPSVAACSIASTQRRRFFWAVWWSGPPEISPFRKPDASNGGARSREEALQQAETAAGRAVVEIPAIWARGWMHVLRGSPAFTKADEAHLSGAPKASKSESADGDRMSAWSILGVARDASADEIKKAFRRKALETHPDRGGDPAVFRAVERAYTRALSKQSKPVHRSTRRGK